MREMETSKFDKLSNLKAELKNVERFYFRLKTIGLAQARNSLVENLPAYIKSRFDLGKLLLKYKRLFKEERGWIAAAEVIAGAIDRDLRTVLRIVDDYERAVQLPPIVLDAMRGQHLDPAAAKNIPILENLVQMPNPETREAAAEAVAKAVQKHEAQKKEKRKAATKPSEMGLEVFAETVVKLFKERFQSASPSEKSTVVQFVLELVVNTLQVPLQELRQYGRPTLVPKPVMKNAA
jgi:hypothetical protein